MDTGLMDFGVAEDDEAPQYDFVQNSAAEEGGESESVMDKLWEAPEVIKQTMAPFKQGQDTFEYIEAIKKNGYKSGEVGPLEVVNGLLDAYTVVKGSNDLGDGIHDGNADQGLKGVHDMVEGGGGLLGNIPGLGPYAKSFSEGFSFGDTIAPGVFGTGHHDTINKEAHAESGNQMIDNFLDGGRSLSDGDYEDGVRNLAEGAVRITEAGADPTSLLPTNPEALEHYGKAVLDSEEHMFNPFGGIAESAGKGIGNWLKDDE